MIPQEIKNTLEDFSYPYRFHVVAIEAGIPVTHSFDPVSLAKWTPSSTTEVVGVFENPDSSRSLQKSLESGERIFIE